MTEPRLTRLVDGLRIVTDPMDSVETLSLGVWIHAGGRHESRHNNGVSHLLEHMAFKGTARRDARAIVEELESVGGQINAYTCRESTAFYCKVLKEDSDLALDILADIVQHSSLDGNELQREKSVIVQEIYQANDTPDDIILDHFQEAAYPDQPIGWPVLGSVEGVSGMARDTVLDYMRAQYAPSRLVVSAAGRVDHDRLVDDVARSFDSLSAGTDRGETLPNYVGGDFRESRDLDQVQLVVGFDGIAHDDPDYHALLVLSSAFGGGMSSRLFQEIREERGLAYSVYAFNAIYDGGGLFAVHAGTGEDDLVELFNVLADETVKLRDGLTSEELDRAKAQLRASVLMSMESSSARCELRARQCLFHGGPVPTTDMVAKLDAVDEDAVRRVARRVTASAPTIATLGAIKGLKDYGHLAERLQ